MILAAAALLALATGAGAAIPTVIDDFEGPIAWTPHPADGVEMAIHDDAGFAGRAMRMDFAFSGGGWAIARREVSLDLPENYEFRFRLRGETRPNHLEFKLVDDSGENVWWSVRRDFVFPGEWDVVAIKKRHISFAWGPLGGGEMRHVAAIEIVVTAGQGGKGSVWIDDFTLRELPPPSATPPKPKASASSARGGQEASRTLDGNKGTSWEPRAEDAAPWIEFDLGAGREFGALVLEWEPEHHAAKYDVVVSDDRAEWRTVWSAVDANGGRDWLFLPETDARYVRVAPVRAKDASLALAEIEVKPLEIGASREAFFEAIAAESPRGTYPRGMSGEQVYWTVVGADGDRRECLLSEDGALETGKGAFSIEPFLFVDGRLVTWANVEIQQSLEYGCLPLPTVTWRTKGWRLDITAFTADSRDSSAVIARYRVTNESDRNASIRFFLGIRPFQVNPPTQFLNLRGGTATIGELEFDGDGAMVNARRRIELLHSWDESGAATFDAGDIVIDHLRSGKLPSSQRVSDPFRSSSGAYAMNLVLDPGDSRIMGVLVPLAEGARPPEGVRGQLAAQWIEEEHARSRDYWRARMGEATINLPQSAQPWADLFRAQIGYILVNRAGPAIQPGSRSYARSWIRDGALTSSALLRVGLHDVVREFIDWFAPHQFENGKIPCVVDDRGADPVPEHDSSGEFIFLVAEYTRFTRDEAFARAMWPRVERAAAYLDSLRLSTRTANPDSVHFDGILPPSISHEGYSAKPMHSYWDDFFGLAGFRDAAYLAGTLRLKKEKARWSRVADEFAASLHSSIEKSMALHDIEYVPGCADLGDFDPTSTTIALSPCGAESKGSSGGGPAVSTRALEQTFELYWKDFQGRRQRDDWDAYTPYELRNVGAFVRLGWRDRAHELLEFFAEHRRPIGWNQWPEVVVREERAPRFLGDLPHTWVGSDYMRSFLDMFAYVETDGDLIVGAGIPDLWLDEGPVAVHGLRTPYGVLDVSITREGAKDVVSLRTPSKPFKARVEVRLPGGNGKCRVPGSVSVPVGRRPR